MRKNPELKPSGLSRLTARLSRGRQTRLHALAERPRVSWALAVLLLALLAAIAWPFTHAHLQSVAVLDLVANKPVPAPLRLLVVEPVRAEELTLPLPSGPVRARMYTPVDKPNAPALIVLHGMHYLGMDEPRMIAFASAMASCGLRVLTPELPGIKDYRLGTNTIATIGDTALWMDEHTGNHPVGVMGLSFSGGLALLAAAAPHYRPAFKFVVTIGAQDDMSHVVDFYRTGEDPRPNGTEEQLVPHEYGPLVIEYEHLQDFVPPADLAPLHNVLRAHLYEDRAAEKAALATLTSTQLAEAKQLMDTGSETTRRELAAVELKHVQDMAGVSPHGHLAQLTTPVYLLHGEADNIIPAAETLWMQQELPSETLKASLISPVISHLDMDGKGPGPLDQWRLVHFFALVLHAAGTR
jgi:acetyl esterase/lipase